MFLRIGAGGRHYGSRGMTAAAMVHRVITIYEGVCCFLCVCCMEDYFHVANTVRGQYYLRAVVWLYFQNNTRIQQH